MTFVTFLDQIPLAIEKMISFLELHGLNTQGIFRISGSVERVHALRDQIDRGSVFQRI